MHAPDDELAFSSPGDPFGASNGRRQDYCFGSTLTSFAVEELEAIELRVVTWATAHGTALPKNERLAHVPIDLHCEEMTQ